MRKITWLGFALVLFSCSQEDNSTIRSIDKKDTRTIDTNIGYESPYDYYNQFNISYIIKNSTNLKFQVLPHFGLGFFDGKDDLTFFNWDLTNPDNEPNMDAYRLISNGKEYGNYITPLNYISLNGFQTVSDSAGMVPCVGAPYSMLFDITGHTTLLEYSMTHKFGKLYFIKFQIENGKETIAGSIVKTNFPHNIHSNIYLPSGWEKIGTDDSYFDEQLIYNKATKEICLTITDDSDFKDTYRFNYQGNTYEVGIRTNQTEVEIYLEQVI